MKKEQNFNYNLLLPESSIPAFGLEMQDQTWINVKEGESLNKKVEKLSANHDSN